MKTIVTAMTALVLLSSGAAIAQQSSGDGRGGPAGTSRSAHERCVGYDRHISTNKLFHCQTLMEFRGRIGANDYYDPDVTGSTSPAPVVGPRYDGDGVTFNDW